MSQPKQAAVGVASVSWQKGYYHEAVIVVGDKHIDLSTAEVLDLTRCLAQLFPEVVTAEVREVQS